MKKLISSLMCFCMAAGVMVGCSDGGQTTAAPETSGDATTAAPETSGDETTAAASGEKTPLNLYVFTDEVQKMVERFLSEHPEWSDKYELKTTVTATDGGAYQQKLDAALAAGGEDAPDIYAAESAFVKKYTAGDMGQYAATYEDLGIADLDKKISDAKLANYTVEIGKNADGKVVGLAYQSTGGVYIYRRSIAKDVFGSDDPEAVAKEIGPGWDKFFEAAKKCKDKGVAIVSGDGDIWHAIENGSDKGWIVDGKLNIDAKREKFFDYSKQLKDNKYHNDTQDWTEDWYADMSDAGKDAGKQPVLGFFGPAWLINYVIGTHPDPNPTKGDWAITTSTEPFFWGGTWILANKDTTKKDVIAAIIEWITLDTSETGLQYLWASGAYNTSGTKDTVASEVVMDKADGTVEFLGGQNMFDYFKPANAAADPSKLTQYDETINGIWRDAVRQYTGGEAKKDEAIATFKTNVKEQLDLAE